MLASTGDTYRQLNSGHTTVHLAETGASLGLRDFHFPASIGPCLPVERAGPERPSRPPHGRGTPPLRRQTPRDAAAPALPHGPLLPSGRKPGGPRPDRVARPHRRHPRHTPGIDRPAPSRRPHRTTDPRASRGHRPPGRRPQRAPFQRERPAPLQNQHPRPHPVRAAPLSANANRVRESRRRGLGRRALHQATAQNGHLRRELVDRHAVVRVLPARTPSGRSPVTCRRRTRHRLRLGSERIGQLTRPPGRARAGTQVPKDARCLDVPLAICLYGSAPIFASNSVNWTYFLESQ
jgi:hypothetical protein